MANEISTQVNKLHTPQVTAQASQVKADDDSEVSRYTVLSQLNDSALTKDEEKAEDTTDRAAEKIRDKITQLNDHMQNLNRSLQFSVDDESGDSIVTVRDAETEEVIRQFPSDELLKARHSIDTVKGMLLEVDV